MKRTLSGPATLLYDQDCGLCVATAGWLRRRVGADRLRVLSIADADADRGVGPFVAGRDLASTIHLVGHDGRVRTGAAAVLAAGRRVPRWGVLAVPFDHRPGHALLEPAYRLVAANRHRIGRALGLPATCRVPTMPETRATTSPAVVAAPGPARRPSPADRS